MSNSAGPPPKEPRVPITVMIRTESRDWLDQVAHEHHLRRADVVRICLGVARAHGTDLANSLRAAADAS